MNQIPTHKSADTFDGEMIRLKHISIENHSQEIDYAHRDDYYMFIFVESGGAKMLIDFEEQTINEGSVYYILPEQVHMLTYHTDSASAWMLAIDSSLLASEHKNIFENSTPFENDVRLSDYEIHELKQIISILDYRINNRTKDSTRGTIHSIVSVLINIISEVYEETSYIKPSNRSAGITSQFKSLLSDNYRTMKRPSEYAYTLNISPTYLNEVVKNTTGITVSESIRNEIIIRAKRLLFHTTMNIKDIALELGYEDWAYFSRLFSKSTHMSPTEFRDNYRK